MSVYISLQRSSLNASYRHFYATFEFGYLLREVIKLFTFDAQLLSCCNWLISSGPLATDVYYTRFRRTLMIIVLLLAKNLPCRLLHEWPKRVGDHNTIKIDQ
jgi:hypothetical protein